MVVPPNVYILLDVTPFRLRLIMVCSTLEFNRDIVDLAVNVSCLFVKGGRLIIGTREEPFPNKAIISLTLFHEGRIFLGNQFKAYNISSGAWTPPKK